MQNLNIFLEQIFDIFDWFTPGKQIDIAILISVIIQLFVIFLLLFVIYRKFIKGTSSEKLVKGIFILLIGWLFGEILTKANLNIIGAFLKLCIAVVAITLVIVFQPELRRFISYLGQTTFWKRMFFPNNETTYDDKVNTLKELTETVKYLSKTKTGGLIVIQPENSHAKYSAVGSKIDAIISAELLLTIFFPKTPLHDGAVIVSSDKIIAAGVLLPLTEDPKLSWRYGTRHRAAIGVTEVSDCACIVVSEETGDISIALDGELKKYESIVDFKADLKKILKIEENTETSKFSDKVLNFMNLHQKDNK